MKVCILDYGSGNVGSVYNLVSLLTNDVSISNSESDIREATHLILPGVGAFGASMYKIHERIPLAVLEEEVLEGNKQFLGICIGMQVLASKGMEFGEHKGLGWIPGTVNKVDSRGLPLPHIGWNNITASTSCLLFKGFHENWDFYFVHSYAFCPEVDECVIARVEYGSEIVAGVQRGNIIGVQFHPEKSQKVGRRLIKNFLGISN
jgi:imidazole glycerol-phosphate synthase subunit HisH